MKRLLVLLLVLSCGDDPAGGGAILEPKPPGIQAEPKWLTYTCVEPGCDTTLTAHVQVVGERDVAIKRIVLSDRDRADFEIAPEMEPPFIIEAGGHFAIDARFLPNGDPRLGDLDLRVTFTDASASETDDRIPPGELVIPLVRRLIGEPRLSVAPSMLNFGPVPPTTQKALPLTVENIGFGNVGLVIDRIDTDPPAEIRVENLPENALIPMETQDLSVIYEPMQESYLEGMVTIYPVAETVIPTVVPLLGTSINHPSLLPQPNQIDFGEVPVGMTSRATLSLVNRGTEDLVIQRLELGGSTPAANLLVEMTDGSTTATVTALASVDVNLDLEALDAGVVDTFLRITSNDREQPVLDLPIVGLVTKPIIQIDPPMIDFGAVPRGWTIVQPMEVTNIGYGELTVTNLGLILGSSELFTVRTVPNFPVTLRHDQRIGIEIEFRSEAEAVFNATLSVDSSDPDSPFVEIPLTATGASCDAGCPIANGTPDCGGGTCDIGTCDPDWYDSDLDPSTGCECHEIGSDPGEFCADGIYLGTLDDGDGDRATFTGILPEESDIDVIRFYGNDSSQVFGDDYDVRVTLESTDPSIRFCIYRHDTDGHLNECFWENERCPTDRYFRRDGSTGPDDSADYTIKVFRDPQFAPSCTSYTLFMRNG